MKTASHQQPSHAAPQRRARHSAAQPGATGAQPDGAAGALTTEPLPDGETRDVQIHRLAYARYVSNGCIDGHALDDWLAAEAEFATLGQGGDAASGRRPDA